MAVLVALDEAEQQVPDVEGPTPHSMAVVLVQRLLVLWPSGGGRHRTLHLAGLLHMLSLVEAPEQELL